jgi:drug/metabolite transporter (DMT)-like permease
VTTRLISLDQPRSGTALVALVAGSIAIGASPLFVRWSELGPLATAAHRMFWALPLLAVWIRWSPPGKGSIPLGAVLGCGLLFAGDLSFWHWSILNTSVANATLLANFAPLVVVFGAWFWLRERVTKRFLAGMALALAGSAVLLGHSATLGERFVRGDVYGLITALFFGSYVLMLARARSTAPAAGLMFYSSAITCVAMALFAASAGESLFPETTRGWVVLIGLAWLSQVAGQGLIAYALGYLPASLSSLVILVEPLSAAIFGWVLLDERLAALQWLGAVAIVAGILVARRPAG